MFGLFKRRVTPSVVNINFVNDESNVLFDALEAAHDARVSELLECNNAQLEENRALKRTLRLAAEAAGQNDLGCVRGLLGEFA